MWPHHLALWFRPLNDDHAVAEVAFSVDLGSPISADALDALRGPARATVPWAQELPAANAFAGSVQLTAAMLFPVQFAFLKPNGQPMWVLRFSGSKIDVECTTYTRWTQIWEKARTYIEQGLAFLEAFQTHPITGVQLKITDQFFHDEEGYNINDFLRGADLVGIAPFSGSPLWHSYNGWFEFAEWGRTLHNLNAQSSGSEGEVNSRPFQVAPYNIAIVHHQMATFYADSPGWPRMEETIGQMHDRNKALLNELLADPICGRIGLKD